MLNNPILYQIPLGLTSQKVMTNLVFSESKSFIEAPCKAQTEFFVVNDDKSFIYPIIIIEIITMEEALSIPQKVLSLKYQKLLKLYNQLKQKYSQSERKYKQVNEKYEKCMNQLQEAKKKLGEKVILDQLTYLSNEEPQLCDSFKNVLIQLAKSRKNMIKQREAIISKSLQNQQKVQKYENTISRLQNQNIGLCKICLDKKANQLNSVCGHLNLCETCVKNQAYSKNCPTCRAEGKYRPVFSSFIGQDLF